MNVGVTESRVETGAAALSCGAAFKKHQHLSI